MSKSHRDPGAFLPLHSVDLRILMVLTRSSAHGYHIVKEIEAREQDLPQIYPGNLYRRIRDLRSKGLLEDTAPPVGVETDPRRRYFRVTDLGQAVVRAEARRLGDLVAEARALGLLAALPESPG
jgi:DNA-binding PadR family transcriptional regulator